MIPISLNKSDSLIGVWTCLFTEFVQWLSLLVFIKKKHLDELIEQTVEVRLYTGISVFIVCTNDFFIMPHLETQLLA